MSYDHWKTTEPDPWEFEPDMRDEYAEVEFRNGYQDGLDNAPWPEDYPSPAYHAGRAAARALTR